MKPRTVRNDNLYKGPSSSAEFNALRNDMQADLSDLFRVINRQDRTIAENMDIVLKQNFFLQMEMQKLQKALQQLPVQANDQDDTRYMKQTFFERNNISEVKNKAIFMDVQKGFISPMPTNTEEKLVYISDSGKRMIPKSTQFHLYESHNAMPLVEDRSEHQYYLVENDKWHAAVDGSLLTYFTRNAKFAENKGIHEVYGILHIVVPSEISNNVNSNSLTIHPFPEYSMTITDILYKTTAEGWKRLDTYPMQTINGVSEPADLEEVGKLFFSFPKREVTEIQIKFKQPYWFSHEDSRIFTYGFQDIRLSYIDYNTNVFEFVTRFRLPDGQFFDRVFEPSLTELPGTPSLVSDTVLYELYLDKELQTSFEFDTTIYSKVQEVYVKTLIKQGGEEVPILKDITLPYKLKASETN
jgi:hypothetical protein